MVKKKKNMESYGAFSSVQNENVFTAGGGGKDFSESELTCPICLEIFDGPVTTRCGHTYCQGCLQECLSRPDPACAMCRTDLRGQGDGDCWAKASELEALIRSSVEACKGCAAKVGLAHMKSHADACAEYKEYVAEGVVRAAAQSRQGGVVRSVSVPNRHTFACPYCDLRNLDQDGLAEHCAARHARDAHHPVVCPVCASMPWGDPNYRSGNFLRHLRTRHAFAYDTFVDYSADEDRMMQEAMERSLAHQ